MKRKPEILAPAGDMEKLRYAIHYGADAVYLAGESFGLRAAADNFTLDEIKAAIAYAEKKDVRLYVAVNVFAHNQDIEGLSGFLESLRDMGPSGLIVSDLGVFSLAKEIAPNLPLHISTQANSVNWKTVSTWGELGARRVVLGRELSLDEIETIRTKTKVELEMFVHGAMCMAYSGRCLLSNYLTGRDANQGACTHPCRWQYSLVEEKRPGEYLPIEENDRGSYIMNSKDLCLLPYLPNLLSSGLDSFKIEGRIKSLYYVATVVKVYREALDVCFADPESFAARLPGWLAELEKVSHREYCNGFLMGPPQAGDHRYQSGGYIREYDFIGIVLGYDREKSLLEVEQRNHFSRGEEVEIMPPQGPSYTLRLEEILDENYVPLTAASHAQMRVFLPIKEEISPMSILRRKK